MFERYTEQARRVVFFARYEASQYGAEQIDTEHLLLGILREDKRLLRFLAHGAEESIRKEVETQANPRKSIATSVDLPLSNAGKRAIAYAAEEAERLQHKHIGSEHLLLGLLREKTSFGARLLYERGANLEGLRARIEKLPEPWATSPRYLIPREKSRPKVTVEIHGSHWDADFIRDAVGRCREHSWHWHKRPWTARDIAIERASGRASFDLGLSQDSANFELVRGGWKKDYCAVCRWELFESKDDAEHGVGYTNGRDWLCSECYEKFLLHPNFFSSSHPEIT